VRKLGICRLVGLVSCVVAVTLSVGCGNRTASDSGSPAEQRVEKHAEPPAKPATQSPSTTDEPGRPPRSNETPATADAKPTSEIRRFEGHTDQVWCVAVSPDGLRALTGGGEFSGRKDFAVRLWEIETGRQLARLEGHEDAVFGVAFLPGGRQGLTASGDCTVRLWDLETAKEVRQVSGHTDFVRSVVVSPTGEFAVSGSLDSTIRVWDIEEGREVGRFAQNQDHVFSVAVSPDSRYALSGGRDKTIHLWDIESRQEVRRFVGHEDSVLSVAFSPDGTHALSASHDNTIRLWEIATGREVRRLVGHEAGSNCVAYTADGQYAVSAANDQTIRLWDVESGQEIHRLSGHDRPVFGVAAVAKSDRILSVSQDRTVRLWRLPALPRNESLPRSTPIHIAKKEQEPTNSDTDTKNRVDPKQREKLLAEIDEKERAKSAERAERIRIMREEVKRLTEYVRKYEKNNPRVSSVQSKKKTLTETEAALEKATAEEVSRADFYENERRKVKAMLPVSGERYTEFDGRFLTDAEIEKIKSERAKAEKSLKELAETNGTPEKAAYTYVKSLYDKGVIKAATYTTTKQGAIEILAGNPWVRVPKEIADGQLNTKPGGSGMLAVQVVYFQCQYVSKGGIVNDREVYVPVIKIKTGYWVEIYDDGMTHVVTEAGEVRSAGFSLIKGSR